MDTKAPYNQGTLQPRKPRGIAAQSSTHTGANMDAMVSQFGDVSARYTYIVYSGTSQIFCKLYTNNQACGTIHKEPVTLNLILYNPELLTVHTSTPNAITACLNGGCLRSLFVGNLVAWSSLMKCYTGAYTNITPSGLRRESV